MHCKEYSTQHNREDLLFSFNFLQGETLLRINEKLKKEEASAEMCN